MATLTENKKRWRRLAARAAGYPGMPQVALVDGDTADTDIAIAGIKTTDIVLSVIHLTAGAAAADLTAEANITSTGNIQLDTTDTSGDQLLVFWVSS